MLKSNFTRVKLQLSDVRIAKNWHFSLAEQKCDFRRDIYFKKRKGDDENLNLWTGVQFVNLELPAKMPFIQ